MVTAHLTGMSKTRENVTWQSPDGTWNRGFYECYTTGDYDDPDFDHEWDVDYHYDVFEWVSAGHATSDAANNAWGGVNPGVRHIVTFDPANSQSVQQAEDFDNMAALLHESGSGYYRGPVRPRSLRSLQSELRQGQEGVIALEVRGKPTGDAAKKVAALTRQIADRLASVSSAGREAWMDELKYTKRLLDGRKEEFARSAQRQRMASRFGGLSREQMQEIAQTVKTAAAYEELAAQYEHQIAAAAQPAPVVKQKTPRPKTTQKPVPSRQQRKGEVGQPTTNKGHFAAKTKPEPDTSLGSMNVPF